jgi:hypothetical protein
MQKRDKNIMEDLKQFRVLTRDHLTQLHFAGLKMPVKTCNTVLKRLRRDNYIKADTNRRPYLYMLKECQIKTDSTKIPHFLELANFYCELSKHQKPYLFEIEPKLGEKGTIEPDIMMIWKNTPLFVEIQRNVYSKQVMKQKIDRYKDYFYRDSWKKLSWQLEKKFFPIIWIITEHIYEIEIGPLKIYQSKDIKGFLQQIKPSK